MKTEQILMATTVLAMGALSKHRFVSFGGTVAAAADPQIGIANNNADVGERAGVNTHGVLLVEAGAAVAVGAQVQSDSTGRAITLAAGVAFGRAMDAATAAGEIIRVLR